MTTARSRRNRRRAVGTACLAAAGVGIGLGLSAAEGPGTSRFVTAYVSTSSVQQDLDVTGTLQPVSRATAAFQVSGTVQAVAVSVGQQVTAGQTLASLQTATLESDLAAAQTALTAAQARLAADEAAPSTNTATTATATATATVATVQATPVAAAASSTKGSSPTVSNGTSAGGARGGSGGSVTTDENAVVQAQHTVDIDIQTSTADLAAVQRDCALPTSTPPPGSTTTTTTTTTEPVGGTTTTGPDTTSSTTSTTSSTSTSTAQGGGSGSQSASPESACAGDLEKAATDQASVASAQTRLGTAETRLADALSSEASSLKSAGSSGTGSSSTSGGAASRPAGSSGSASGTGKSSSGSSVSGAGAGAAAAAADTPEQLARDQATIDTDEAALVEAQQSLGAASLTSPINGTVATIGMSPGQSVTAASSSASITIVDSGGYQTVASLTSTQVAPVKVGDTAQVSVDGVNAALTAIVASIDPVQASSGSYTYPVTLAVEGSGGQMPVGAASHAVIDLADAGGALVVPTSAVHAAGVGSYYVYRYDAGKEVRQRITPGVVGTVYTQVRSGLSSGETVVLADRSQAVPSSSTNTSTRTFAGLGAGGLGGAGLRGAGAGALRRASSGAAGG